jgi:hypothetical protein
MALIHETVNIHGHTVHILVGEDVVVTTFTEDRRHEMTRAEYDEHKANLVDALNRIPEPHARFLTAVPIMIVKKKPGGVESGGGWFPPDDSGGGAHAWTGGGVRNTRIPASEVNSVDFSNGIIAVTTIRLNAVREGDSRFMWINRPTADASGDQLYKQSLLHEVGHCIDYHYVLGHRYQGLTSRPRDAAYRNGNRPYQGQKYPQTPRSDEDGYLQGEFKVETYSRLFFRPEALCRRGQARPQCLNSSGHHRCAERLQRDLAATPAFAAHLALLPLASDPATSAGHAPAGGAQAGPEGLRLQAGIPEPSESPQGLNRGAQPVQRVPLGHLMAGRSGNSCPMP